MSALSYLRTIAEVAEVLGKAYRQKTACTLLKIKINPATEVVRLSEPDHLAGETRLLKHMETIIAEEFKDSPIYQLSFSAYMVILDGAYDDVATRLHDFVDDVAPRRICLGDKTYYPKTIVGITELEDNLGVSLSRLEFATRKASVSANRTSCYVPRDDADFACYQCCRVGLRILRRALDNAELGLFAQPIVAMDAVPGTKARKFEVLLRHYQDATTIAPPVDMLMFANFNDVTQDLDLYVIELLCRNFSHLFGSDGKDVDTVTINISGPSFIRPHFADTVIALVKRYDVPTAKLVLEITEDVANSAKKQALSTMEAFRAAGFRLALDDIGTGSSNFRTLHEFPVDFFKIDRSYCEDVQRNSSVRAFVQLIIDIGKDHAKTVIAEGIPDEETHDLLRAMGVDFSQSFLTGRPCELIPAPKFAPEM